MRLTVQEPALQVLAAMRQRSHLLSVAYVNWAFMNKSYRDELFQSALGKDAIEFWPKWPLCENGKHNALQNHGLGPLKFIFFLSLFGSLFITGSLWMRKRKHFQWDGEHWTNTNFATTRTVRVYKTSQVFKEDFSAHRCDGQHLMHQQLPALVPTP